MKTHKTKPQNIESRIRNSESRIGIYGNEKGIALVIVMVLSAIGLALMAGLVYMLTSGTQISGIQKRYKTALEAGTGGADVTFQLIGKRGDPGIPLTCYTIIADPCLTDKLTKATANWNTVCDKSLIIIPCPPQTTCNPTACNSTYDISFDLGQTPNTYKVYAKISDTVLGNSAEDSGLIKNGVVATNTGEVTVMSIPYLYTIEIDSENAANPAERAKLSVLYQY